MFCGLGEEEHTKFRKKKRKKGQKRKKKEKIGKKKKKNKKLIVAKSGLIGIKGYRETYNHIKNVFHTQAVFD